MKICTTCGYLGKTTTQTKGNIAIEIVLWLFFIVPGLIYSLWRLTSTEKVCPACKNPTMIPTNTPRGHELFEAAQKKHPAMVQSVVKKEGIALNVKLVLVVILVVIVAMLFNAILKM